jgi:hypothetical protein
VSRSVRTTLDRCVTALHQYEVPQHTASDLAKAISLWPDVSCLSTVSSNLDESLHSVLSAAPLPRLEQLSLEMFDTTQVHARSLGCSAPCHSHAPCTEVRTTPCDATHPTDGALQMCPELVPCRAPLDGTCHVSAAQQQQGFVSCAWSPGAVAVRTGSPACALRPSAVVSSCASCPCMGLHSPILLLWGVVRCWRSWE